MRTFEEDAVKQSPCGVVAHRAVPARARVPAADSTRARGSVIGPSERRLPDTMQTHAQAIWARGRRARGATCERATTRAWCEVRPHDLACQPDSTRGTATLHAGR